MTKCVFITGTDTDVGKTYISSVILMALQAERLLTCGFKPIASGGTATATDRETSHNGLVNTDALILQRHATLDLPYRVVNPFCFEPAIAPHVAAQEAGVKLSVAQLDDALIEVKQSYPVQAFTGQSGEHCPQVILTEGAGGWHVPLNESERLSDWVAGQKMGVILVVGLKLGCINHALLTCEAITNSGVPLLGWIANRPSAEPMSREADTLAYLKNAIDAPLIADVSFSTDPQPLDAEATRALIQAIG